MINPMSMLSPKQAEQITAIQTVSHKIQAEIATTDNGMTLRLLTEDPEAAKLIPQIRELVVNGCATSLYQFFNITGKMV